MSHFSSYKRRQHFQLILKWLLTCHCNLYCSKCASWSPDDSLTYIYIPPCLSRPTDIYCCMQVDVFEHCVMWISNVMSLYISICRKSENTINVPVKGLQDIIQYINFSQKSVKETILVNCPGFFVFFYTIAWSKVIYIIQLFKHEHTSLIMKWKCNANAAFTQYSVITIINPIVF